MRKQKEKSRPLLIEKKNKIRNRCIVLLTIIASGAFVGTYGGRISYALFYVSLFLPLTAFLYILFVYQQFRYLQTIHHPNMLKGKPAEYTLTLSNECPVTFSGVQLYFFHDCSSMLGMEEELPYQINGGEKIALEGMLLCRYRGEYNVGLKEVVITDFWKLFSVRFLLHGHLMVTVLPNLKEWEHHDFIGNETDDKNKLFLGGREEEPDAGVRKFVNGDSMRKIHWKATARQQELMTRSYQSIPKETLHILLDFSPVDEKGMTRLRIEDCVIEKGLSLARFCYEQQIPCSVSYETAPKESQTSRLVVTNVCKQDDLNELQMTFAKLLFSAKSIADQLIQQTQANPSFEHQIILITHSMNDQLVRTLMELDRIQQRISVFLILDEKNLLKLEECTRMMAQLKEYGLNTMLYISKAEVGEEETHESF